MTNAKSSSFLRRVLFADALSCAGMGLLLMLGAPVLAGALSLPEVLLRETGIVLLPCAAFVAWIVSRAAIPRGRGVGPDRDQCPLGIRQRGASRGRLGAPQRVRLRIRPGAGRCRRGPRRARVQGFAPFDGRYLSPRDRPATRRPVVPHLEKSLSPSDAKYAKDEIQRDAIALTLTLAILAKRPRLGERISVSDWARHGSN